MANRILQVACGDDFSLALSEDGNVFSTGFGKYGIHGMGTNSEETANRFSFEQIGSKLNGFFKQKIICYISAGE